MKSFIVICVVLVAGIHAEEPETQEEKAQRIAFKCFEETGVDYEVIEEARKRNFLDDEGLKKYLFCFLNTAGIVDKHGKLIIETAMAKLPPSLQVYREDIKKTLELCKSESGDNAFETVFKIFMCCHENSRVKLF